MKLYSTNNKNRIVNLEEAVLKSLAPGGGLYMPCDIPRLDQAFIDHLSSHSFEEIALAITKNLVGTYIPEQDLANIINKSIFFKAPLVEVNDRLASLELWHGPSLAFKDFGAQFMAQLISYFNRNKNKKTTILVATSGDTGGAVGAGFHKAEGIEVVILFPKGKVSYLQEQQLTTLGDNVRALEIEGTFDDCQAIVKTAFLDQELNQQYSLSSANSINIARLIPQSFYFFEAAKQVKDKKLDLVFSVPSGNFGNLTAGVMAQTMGLAVKRFIAATNSNDVVPEYLETGVFTPRPSIQTISNAMDVGNPSNFIRLHDLFGSTWNNMREVISGFRLSDAKTRDYMKHCYDKYKYICDPHGAIAYAALQDLKKNEYGIFLETAHPSKFLDIVNDAIGIECPIPNRLAELKNKSGAKTSLSKNFDDFKSWML